MNTLDEIAKIKQFYRLTWHIDNEPTERPKGSYYKTYMPITGIPYWEEADDYYRKRIMNEIDNAKKEA